MLPPVGETLYIIDEAHSLAAKAIDHASAKHALRGAREWLAGAAEAVCDAVLALRLDAALLRDALASAQTLSYGLGSLHQRITATRGLDEKPARRFKGRMLPAWARATGENPHAAAYDLQQTLAAARAAILGRVAMEPSLATRVLSALGFYATKVDKLIDAWDLMLADDSKTGVPIARWVERYDDASDSPDILVCAAPITGSDRLRHLLWNRAAGAILMSATLRSCGSFEPFLRQTGLAGFSGLGCLQVDSPFDYRSNARLMIPAVRADPTDAEAHTLEVSERLPELVNTRGTLVLFASARQMRAVHARLPEALREITLLQGTMPKMQMLARHRAAIDRGERSILFGLQSMAEGVDLPGELCTHVICIKLPFSKADSPLEEARHEWLEAQGRSAFLELSVPEAALRLKQQLGRLLRTTDDYGTATILDRRVVTRRCGRLLLLGLPDFELVIERASGHASSQGSAERP